MGNSEKRDKFKTYFDCKGSGGEIKVASSTRRDAHESAELSLSTESSTRSSQIALSESSRQDKTEDSRPIISADCCVIFQAVVVALAVLGAWTVGMVVWCRWKRQKQQAVLDDASSGSSDDD